ncbi:hypothetical protein SprV_0301352700 [Sparganum proliferum]
MESSFHMTSWADFGGRPPASADVTLRIVAFCLQWTTLSVHSVGGQFIQLLSKVEFRLPSAFIHLPLPI